MAVKPEQVLAQLAEIEEALDAAQEVIGWDVVFEIEGIEQLLLCAARSPHHRIRLPWKASGQHNYFRRVFVLVFQQNRPEADTRLVNGGEKLPVALSMSTGGVDRYLQARECFLVCSAARRGKVLLRSGVAVRETAVIGSGAAVAE
jgi:hypothetical protein